MNLKKETTNRSYEEITKEAEPFLKEIIAAFDGENSKRTLAVYGTKDGIIFSFDEEEKINLIRKEDEIKLVLLDTDEYVVLNEEDAAQVKELILDKIDELRQKRSCPMRSLAGLLAIPVVLGKLREEGKDPAKMSMEELMNEIKKFINE